jgi:hypothetical protein
MKRALLTAALTLAAALPGCGGGSDAPAVAPTPSPPTPPPAEFFPVPDPASRVSGPAPFAAGCDGVAATGTIYVNAEVEPQVAASPVNGAILVGAWQQNRWSNGAAQGVLTGYSTDGGVTWSTSQPAFSRCTGGTAANGGDYERATDPWVSFGADGTVHAMALVLSGNGSNSQVNAMLASRSTDGGRTWSAPATLIRETDPAYFNDKNTLTADPTDARYIYAVWDRLGANTGPTLLARSVDGGANWEPARVIYDPGNNAQTIGNLIVVSSSGVLVNVFTRIGTGTTASSRAEVTVLRSTDRGANWSAPIKVADLLSIGASDPENPNRRVRDGAILPQAAAGPAGEIYIVWQDARDSGGARDAIVLAKSNDAGLTWSAPLRVNRDPSVPAFTPQIHVRPDGTVGISHYDLRSNTADAATLPTDYWLLRSSDGGASWSETRLAGPFDLALAPDAGGLFLGDYQGLTRSPNGFLAFFVQTTRDGTGNRTDVFRREVLPGAAVSHAAITLGTAPPGAAFAARTRAAVTRAIDLRRPPR